MRLMDETVSKSHKSTIMQHKYGVLTGWCVRHITSLSSWRPVRVDTDYGAQLSTSLASMGLSGHHARCSNGSAAWFQQGSLEVYSSATPAKREPTIAPFVNTERSKHTMGKLAGKVAVVTGGSAGIGQGIVAGVVAK